MPTLGVVVSTPWESMTSIELTSSSFTALVNDITPDGSDKGFLPRRGLKLVRVDRFQRDGDPCGWWFEVPKSSVLIKPGKRRIRMPHYIKGPPVQ